MPCRDGREDEQLAEELRRTDRKIEALETMLCDACAALVKIRAPLSEAQRVWYDAHLREDEDRRAEHARDKRARAARLRQLIADSKRELKELGG